MAVFSRMMIRLWLLVHCSNIPSIVCGGYVFGPGFAIWCFVSCIVGKHLGEEERVSCFSFAVYLLSCICV